MAAEVTVVTAKGCIPDLGYKIYVIKYTKASATDYITLTKAAEVIREAAGTAYGFYMDNIVLARASLDSGPDDPVSSFTSGTVVLSTGATGAGTALVIGY